jgi:hypothetical protein
MKTDALLVGLLCSLLGCTASRDAGGNTQSSGLQSPSEYKAPVPQPAPRGEAPPVIFVSGDFRKTGSYAWTNGMMLKDGIDAAGGFNEYARRLIIIHEDGSRKKYRLGPGRILTSNPALRPGDRIYSPWNEL